MGKWIIAIALSFGSSSAWAFQKMDSKYQLAFGNSKAPIQVVEYFSLSCEQCIRFFNDDFGVIKSKYLDSNEVSWVFHPDPADLATLQFMVCLDHLEEGQKNMFLNVVMKMFDEKSVKSSKLPNKYTVILQKILEELKVSVPNLGEISYLEKTDAFQKAYAFLKQKDVVQTIPTVEINGTLLDEYPSLDLLNKKLSTLIEKGKSL